MTIAEKFAEYEGFREGEPHRYQTDDLFWADGEARLVYGTEEEVAELVDEHGNLNAAKITTENSFGIIIKDCRDTPEPMDVVRYEFEDGSAIIFNGRDWAFGLSEDELKNPDILRRWEDCPDPELPIAFINRDRLLHHQ
ncbi:MAG: hypothetical protein OXC63_08245 [Aestuariivita sp.]|nr:hypothetical protein [Aestuariivita sp.]MCY4345381.1 hypothetical protein [Aestuariivita sp.]